MDDRSIICKAAEVLRLLACEEVEIRRAVAARTSLVDGRAAIKFFGELDMGKAWGPDAGPSPAGNPGPYLHAPRISHETSHRVYPRWQVGDRQWVKETWADADVMYGEGGNECPGVIAYRADKSAIQYEARKPSKVPAYDIASWNFDVLTWRSPVHMPRWASRLSVEIAAVRCERSADGQRWEWVVVARWAEVMRKMAPCSA